MSKNRIIYGVLILLAFAIVCACTVTEKEEGGFYGDLTDEELRRLSVVHP